MRKRSAVILMVLILLSAVTVLSGEGITVEGQDAQFSGMKPDIGSVFLQIKNNTKTDDALLGAEVSIKGAYAELHNVKDNGMIKVDRIPVPAGTTVTLKRGSFHIMLFNLPVEVKEGDKFTLTLLFEKSGKKEINVTFSKAGHHMHSH